MPLLPREPEEAIAEAWRRVHGAWDPFEASAFHVFARRTLERLLVALDEAGVPAIVVKGGLLAHTLYATPVERPLRDLDVKVRARDLDRAAALLVAKGGKVVRSSRSGANVVGTFGGMEIDVEARLGPPLVCALRVEDLLDRARRTDDTLGVPHWRIEEHDHALILAVDLFKDHVGAKPWARWDLSRVAASPTFDVRALATRATAARCTTIVHVVARHVAESTGDARWRAIAERIRPRRRAYAERMVATLAGVRRLPAPFAILEARAASDSRARCVGSLALSAWWRWTDYGSRLRT